MADQRKRHKESDVQSTPEQEHENRKKQKKVEANLEPSGIEDSDALEPKKQHECKERKYLKKLKKQKKKIDELNNRLNEMTEIVKKLQKKSDLPEISLKEKETPKECCFEDKDADIKNREALKLDQSCLGGQLLLVTMAIKREEYSYYINHHGCGRCRKALMKRKAERFYESFRVSPEFISKLRKEIPNIRG